MATIRDVSKLAGVSVATVSRIINKKGYVSKETEEAVLKAMKMLKYTPSDVARRLAGKKANTIGLIIPNILNPFFPEIARAAEDTAHRLGYNLILCNTDNDVQKEKQYYDMLFNKQVDGIMICSYTATPEELLSIIEKGMPLVVLDKEYSEYDIPSVYGKNKEGGKLAAKHLIECGCKNIACIMGPLDFRALQDRFNGFQEVLMENDLYKADLVKPSEVSMIDGYNKTKELLESGKKIDGIFAANDILAIGCYKALRDMNLEIYKDIKLIGYDGLEANINYLEISSIAQPMYDFGERAVKLLIRKIEKGEDISKEKIRLDAKLIERRSTIG